MRAGIDNRLHGAIISIMELTLFAIPFSVVEYMVGAYCATMSIMFDYAFPSTANHELVLLVVTVSSTNEPKFPDSLNATGGRSDVCCSNYSTWEP